MSQPSGSTLRNRGGSCLKRFGTEINADSAALALPLASSRPAKAYGSPSGGAWPACT